MRGFNAANRLFLPFDAVDEVSPEEFQVVTVGFLQPGVLMNDLFPGVRGVKCPAVPPTHVEDAVLAVEVATDLVFLRWIFRIAAMFPGGGEGFELIDRDLGVGSVGGLLPVGQDRFTPDRTAPGGIDASGILFLRPPENLVKPVDPPVTKGAIGEIPDGCGC